MNGFEDFQYIKFDNDKCNDSKGIFFCLKMSSFHPFRNKNCHHVRIIGLAVSLSEAASQKIMCYGR
jgi:hypothetical protein